MNNYSFVDIVIFLIIAYIIYRIFIQYCSCEYKERMETNLDSDIKNHMEKTIKKFKEEVLKEIKAKPENTMEIPPVISPEQVKKLECVAVEKYLDHLTYSKKMTEENAKKLWNHKYATSCSKLN